MAHRIFDMAFSKVYPHYVQKALKKGRTEQDVRKIMHWLTGYDDHELNLVLAHDVNFRDFFLNAPILNENRHLISGKICGVDIVQIDDPLMKEIRYLDKLIDELAHGKPMEKILRKQN